MSASTITVTFNALLLNRVQFADRPKAAAAEAQDSQLAAKNWLYPLDEKVRKYLRAQVAFNRVLYGRFSMEARPFSSTSKPSSCRMPPLPYRRFASLQPSLDAACRMALAA